MLILGWSSNVLPTELIQNLKTTEKSTGKSRISAKKIEKSGSQFSKLFAAQKLSFIRLYTDPYSNSLLKGKEIKRQRAKGTPKYFTALQTSVKLENRHNT